MAWTTPRNWVVGEVVTSTLLNTHVRDNLNAVRMTVGTAVPTSGLVTGDVFTLTDSLTAPTWQWMLVYDSSITDTYKWRFVGGDSLYHERVAGNAANTTYSTMKTYSGLPAGIYLCEISQDSQGAPEAWYASIGFGGSAASDGDAAVAGGGSGYVPHRLYQKTAAAGAMIFAMRKTDGTNETVGGARWRVQPVRIST